MELSVLINNMSLSNISWAVLFSLIGVLLSALSTLLTVFSLRKKLRARESLVSILSTDEAFLREMERVHAKIMDDGYYAELDEIEVAELQKLIAGRLAYLAAADQKLLEPPLRQQSDKGRARYIGSLAKDVDLRLQIQHAA